MDIMKTDVFLFSLLIKQKNHDCTEVVVSILTNIKTVHIIMELWNKPTENIFLLPGTNYEQVRINGDFLKNKFQEKLLFLSKINGDYNRDILGWYCT